ncbi:MAG: radical SAM protein [Promethearchaeota archaeon]
MEPELRSLYIYLTDSCNLHCMHCWQSAPLAGKGNYSNLKFNECKNFLDDAIGMGLRSVTFSGGEPLLNSEFHKFAEYFYRNYINMNMETNGILISDNEILNTIKDYKVYCAVSLDGINPETHNKYRGTPHAFQRTILSINKLEQEKIYYQIIMSISKFNYHELIPLLDWIKENCKYCNKFKINIVNALGRAERMNKKGLLFKAEELSEITEKVATLVGKYHFKILLHINPVFFSFKNLLLKYSCGGHCGYMFALSILANGNVSICSLGKQMNKYIFGHVSTIDVKNVWENHPVLTAIHENPHTKLNGVCSKCIFRKYCLGGCRAEALWAYGDFFAPNPICQAYYDSGKFPKKFLINTGGSLDIKLN